MLPFNVSSVIGNLKALHTNSGAESKTEAAFALMDELPWQPLLASHPRPALDGRAVLTAQRPQAVASRSEGE